MPGQHPPRRPWAARRSACPKAGRVQHRRSALGYRAKPPKSVPEAARLALGRVRQAQPLVVSRSPADPPRFIICGSGRSGTSAVAQLLHEAGLSVGHDLIAARRAQRRRLLRRAPRHRDQSGDPQRGRRWSAVLVGDPRADHRRRAGVHRLHGRSPRQNATPAWKDPRFCWTLEPWLVRPRRPPQAHRLPAQPRRGRRLDDARTSGRSATNPRAPSTTSGASQYERLLEIIDAYALTATTVEYAELHRDPAAAVARLSQFVGRPLDPSLIRTDLRHHEVEMPEDLRPWYDRVLALSQATSR